MMMSMLRPTPHVSRTSCCDRGYVRGCGVPRSDGADNVARAGTASVETPR